LGVQQADWIAEVLQPQIHVSVASGDEETFRSEFSSPEYDAAWVTTHGEFDHMDPHRSKLLIVINEGTEMKQPAPKTGWQAEETESIGEASKECTKIWQVTVTIRTSARQWKTTSQSKPGDNRKK
jgi:hypothetical protein